MSRFLARVYGCTGVRTGPPEVVQEALADLKRTLNGHFSRPAETDPYAIAKSASKGRYFRAHTLWDTVTNYVLFNLL